MRNSRQVQTRPASDPDHASSCCQPRVGEAAHGEQEHEGRDVLQRVLVRALDAIEDLKGIVFLSKDFLYRCHS